MTTVSELVSMRDVYGSLIVELGGREPRLVILDADLSKSTRTDGFRQKFPSRYLNVGIAEQNMVGIAAGISLAGGIPFVNTFASFLTRRAADQIAISVAYPRLNVKLFGFHAGINLGEDGATQQAVEDLGIMQAIPGFRVYAPIDGDDLKGVLQEILGWIGPTYVRLSRFPSPVLTRGIDSANAGDGYYILREGRDLTVIASGTVTSEAVQAAEMAAQHGVDVEVIGVSRIKPLSVELIGRIAGKAMNRLVVIDEHNVFGGLADALSNALDQYGVPHRIERIGIQDRFGESGPPADLLEKFGLGRRAIVKKLIELFDHHTKGEAQYAS